MTSVLQYWYTYYDADLKSSFGIPGVRNGIAAEGYKLRPGDHQTVQVTLLHKGAGWSELRAPFAGGLDLGQGYHIGNSGFEYSQIRIFYVVTSPNGTVPDDMPGLRHWIGGDQPWLPYF